MPKSQPLPWANIYTREPDVAKGEAGSQRVLPPDVRRKLAKKSSAGGRGQCVICQEYFSQEYLTTRIIRFLTVADVCADCQAQHKFQMAPKGR